MGLKTTFQQQFLRSIKNIRFDSLGSLFRLPLTTTQEGEGADNDNCAVDANPVAPQSGAYQQQLARTNQALSEEASRRLCAELKLAEVEADLQKYRRHQIALQEASRMIAATVLSGFSAQELQRWSVNSSHHPVGHSTMGPPTMIRCPVGQLPGNDEIRKCS